MSMQIVTEKEEYHPGDTVRGYVQVIIDKPIKARGIHVYFEGREHAVVSRGSGKHRHVYIQNVMIAQDTTCLWSPGDGEGIVGPCNEQYQFEFKIPENAMPTLDSPFNYSLSGEALSADIRHTVPLTINGYIRYMIHAKVDRPLAIDIKAKQFVTVTLLPRTDVSMQPVSFTSHDGGEQIRVDITLDKGMFAPGEAVNGSFVFQRNPQKAVRALEVMLGFSVSITAQGRTDVYKQLAGTIRFPVEPGTEAMHGSFALNTFPGGPISVPGSIVKLEWVVEAKVDLPGKIDKHVYVPIWILPLAGLIEPAIIHPIVVQDTDWKTDEGNLVETDAGEELWQLDASTPTEEPESDPEEDALWEKHP